MRKMTLYYINNINLINKILSEKVNLYTYRKLYYFYKFLRQNIYMYICMPKSLEKQEDD